MDDERLTMSDDVVDFLKKAISMGLLVFSSITVAIKTFHDDTQLSQDVPDIVAFLALLVSLLWLSRVEGGQACMVGLPPVDKKLYKSSHPITHRCTSYGHRGDNLDRFLMGRQFMVLVLVFVINLAGTPAENANYRIHLTEIFMNSGIAIILITAMLGQLTTQVTASTCMLDFANSHFMLATVYVAMAIEASGLLHATYLFHFIFVWLTGQRGIVSDEPPRTTFQSVVFWAQVLLSTGFLTIAFIVTLSAIFEGKTTMWDSVPTMISVILFLGIMGVLGVLEGMQIAFFAVARVTEDERNANMWSRWSCELAFGGDGKGLPRFLIGRQLCVAACYIMIARIATPHLEDGDDNILKVRDGAQKFLETGLMSALVTTIVASTAKLMAATFPMEVLRNPITYVIFRGCLLVEATGICSFALVLSEVLQEFSRYEPDEEHIGTAEGRAAMGFADKIGKAGTMAGGAFPADFAGLAGHNKRGMYSMGDLEEHMEDLQDQLKAASTDAERDETKREIKFLEKLMEEQRTKDRMRVLKAQNGGSGNTGDTLSDEENNNNNNHSNNNNNNNSNNTNNNGKMDDPPSSDTSSRQRFV